ncbi:M20/M25/M40 family metallo-hydrolase [Parerythrobacter jejuensis]|uniref:M20/M25/M40 family metallo-hydrolase n=1 Tax=Parerythrobacter jejuensis TaxID=795812 RepID=A0A845AS00_9SPHN|nr:M20/M25/M40 family metallo-hydrolase [Parerythrobacter jejuensis]MXP32364.1 M20/M25/M40 family metallo-hydrolase [Parerythrobacter jejuensis]
MRKLVLVAALLASPLVAQDHPASNVSAERLEADVEKLVSFGTRHTLSEQDNPTRGIGAAVDWGADEFRRISKDCNDCLEVMLPETTVQGRRIPVPTRLRNAVAIQRGSERPNEVIIVQGHIDSRVTDPLDWKSDAPGANDDASGTALVIEAARVLSRKQYPTTIIYALLSGEEQGLYGGRLMADWVTEQGFTVKAVLNNDVVGNSCGSDGYCDADNVRVFSEGPRADLTDVIRAAQRRSGGENDSPGRNLSRWLDLLADETSDGINVRQIWRVDRMGRGGDQIPFLEAGYPAVRITVAVEDYEHQHQDLRVEDGVTYGDTTDEMDFAYLARVTQLNVRALDRLARTPLPPAPIARAAVRTFTELEWAPVAGADSYHLYRRRTDEPYWSSKPIARIDGDLPADAAGEDLFKMELEGIRGDDWFFGVSACAADTCSPVASAVPAGAFEPVAKEGDDTN